MSQIAQAAKALQVTASSVERLLTTVHQDKVSSTLTHTLESLSNLSEDFSAGSTTYKELNHTMQSLQSTLKDLQPLLLQLNSAPNSFIFSDGNEPNLIPKAKRNNNEKARN